MTFSLRQTDVALADIADRLYSSEARAGIGSREFVCMIAALMALMALGLDMMLPALPVIGRSLGVEEPNQRQWIIGVYLLSFGFAQIVYGPLSDRFGRRPLMLGGMVGYAVFSLCAAAAANLPMMLMFRALQGISISATRVVTTSMVRDCYAGRSMARIMSMAQSVFQAVPVLAPSIGQLIMLALPWRGLFVVLAVYTVLVFTWVAIRLRETLHPEYRRPLSIRTIGAGFITVMSNRQARGYVGVQMLLTGALLGFVNSVQQIFSDVFHQPQLMPMVFAGVAGMMAIASVLNARIVERLGTRRVAHTAILGYTLVGMIHLGYAVSGHETMWSFAVFQGLTSFCFGLAIGNISAISMEPLAELAGTAASIQGVIMTVGGAIIAMIVGQLFNGSTVPVTASFMIAGMISIALIFCTEGGKLFQPRMGR
jgi:MFS transporter, DHA1 family, multidrug resistance protein